MSLYNQCLVSVVLNGGYKTDDLVHTIQADIDVLQCFKNKLHEWNEMFEMINQIHQRMDIFCYYRSCDCSIQIDCECSPYCDFEVRPECELEIATLTKEEEDLQLKLDQLRKETICLEDKIPLWLKDVVRIIIWKMDYQWICFLNMNL